MKTLMLTKVHTQGPLYEPYIPQKTQECICMHSQSHSKYSQPVSPNCIVGRNTATHPQIIGNPAIHELGKHDSSDDGAEKR
jgi:hypothetical protein